MSHTNPFWLGAACVVLGALLWTVPACWSSDRPRPPNRPEAPEPTRAYANLAWGPLGALSSMVR
jgi:hypothetical protein